MFGGKFNDFFVVGFGGIIIFYMFKYVNKLKLNNFFINILGGFLIIILLIFVIKVGLVFILLYLVIGIFMFLVFGFVFINVIRDLINGDLIVGIL